MGKAVEAWISHNEKRLKSLEVQVVSSKESVRWHIMQADTAFTLLIPSDSTSNFTALPEKGDSLNAILIALNDRLENIKPSQSGGVERALGVALQAVELHLLHDDDEEDEDGDGEYEEDDYGLMDAEDDDGGCFGRYGVSDDTLVNRLALEAQKRCEYALVDTQTDMEDNLLAWCSVSVDAHWHAVMLSIDVRGILFDSRNFSTALGFPFDGSELFIEIQLADDDWFVTSLGKDFMESAEIMSYMKDSLELIQRKRKEREDYVNREEDMKNPKDGEIRMKKTNQRDEDVLARIAKEDEMRRLQCEKQLKIMNVIEGTLKKQNFGARVVVPEIIKEFKRGNGWWNGDNVFADLLVYVCRSLRELRHRCVVCKKPLPHLSPLFFCDAEFCLYEFEEERMGVSLLQELQNTKLARFLIATALQASTLGRDVFEPFPPFLLKRHEIRKRSGFFSDIQGANKKVATSSYQTYAFRYYSYENDMKDNNKDLDLLMRLINEFPSIEEMQRCSSEIELIFKMGIPWADINSQVDKISSSKGENVSSKDMEKLWDDKQWRPYNLLRFILFTNRLLMRPLPNDVELPMSSYCQFVIIKDSQKEELFEKRKQKYGSVFAFHGSGACNWYSIIRNGLRSLSNTKFMSAGAACGDGIYFAKDSSYSLAYTSAMKIENDTSCSIMAICEIIDGPKHDKGGNILVVAPGCEEDVAIRYVILLSSSSSYSDNYSSFVYGHSNDQASLPSITGGCLLKDVNLLEHYHHQKEEYIHDCIIEGLVQRSECIDLLDKKCRIKTMGT